MPDSPDAPPTSTATVPPPPTEVTATPEDTAKQTIQGRAVRGTKVLALRTVVATIVRIGSSLVLAHFLTKQDFGVFAAISGIVGIGLFLCEFSLNNMLIVQKDEPDPDETATVFWVQQSVSVFFIATVVLLSGWVLRIHGVDARYVPMLCVCVAGILPVTLRSVPGSMMERHLQFEPGARAEVAEQVVQTAISITLAVSGFGTWALVASFVAARFAGMLVVRAYSDWSLQGRFQWHIARRMVSKAIPFQANQLVMTAVSTLVTLVVARSLGVAALGMFGWANNIASAPILLVHMLQRIAFPTMSRLQDDASEVGRVTGRTSRRAITLMGLLVSPVAIVAPFFLPLIFGEQWRPAVVLFQWSISEVVLTAALGVLAQTMLAMGFSRERTIVMAVAGVLRITLIYFGARLLGVSSVAAAGYCSALVELAILTFQVRHRIPGSETIWRDVFVPVIRVQGALIMTLLVAQYLSPQKLHTLPGVIGQLGMFAVLVTVPDLFSARRPVITELVGTWNMLRTRRTG